MSEQTSSTRPCTSEWGGEGLGPDSAAEKGRRTWAGTCVRRGHWRRAQPRPGRGHSRRGRQGIAESIQATVNDGIGLYLGSSES